MFSSSPRSRIQRSDASSGREGGAGYRAGAEQPGGAQQAATARPRGCVAVVVQVGAVGRRRHGMFETGVRRIMHASTIDSPPDLARKLTGNDEWSPDVAVPPVAGQRAGEMQIGAARHDPDERAVVVLLGAGRAARPEREGRSLPGQPAPAQFPTNARSRSPRTADRSAEVRSAVDAVRI
jgi:hypothetical protein